MKINYNDLTNSNSLVVKMLQQLEDERKKLEKRADRIWKLDCALTNLIQDGRITDTKDIDCAMAWLNHSDLEPYEIVNKILGE